MVEDTGAATAYSAPRGGASLMLSFRLESKTVVVVGGNNLAAARAFAALEADARVVVICAGGASSACAELQWRASQGHLQIIDPASFQFSSPSPVPHSTPDGDTTLLALADLLSSSEERVQLVCVTDTMLGSPSRRSHASAAALARTCRTNGVPISVADEPVLCDFSFAAVHRFTDPATGEKTPLQIAVSTSGQGCRLAGRVRREIVSRLPKAVGGAAAGVARLRALARANIKRELPAAPRAAPIVNGNTDHQVNGNADTPLNNPADVVADFEAEASEDFVTPNAPVPQRVPDETPAERARRQMRWVAQVSEYWPLAQLAQLTDADASRVLTGDFDTVHGGAPSASAPTRPLLTHLGDTEIGSSFHLLALAVPPAPPPRKGRILLVGSGPGHPALLTRATHTALTELADLVLSDKLVPAPILALVPPQTEVRIARKFPGNAEGAQQEMMEAAVAAAERGLTVVRVCLFHIDDFCETDVGPA
jgi:uroporphyrin-III C-methyltransferase